MRFVFLLFILLFPALSHAQEQTEMSIQFATDGSAHVLLESKAPPKFEELKKIINETRVKNIYHETLSSIFKDIKNLNIRTEQQSLIVEFDCKLAEEREGEWIIKRIDFAGALNPVTLRIKIPEGFEVVNTDPLPAQVSEGTLVWQDANFIPSLSYKRAYPIKSLFVAILVLGIISILLIKKFKF